MQVSMLRLKYVLTAIIGMIRPPEIKLILIMSLNGKYSLTGVFSALHSKAIWKILGSIVFIIAQDIAPQIPYSLMAKNVKGMQIIVDKANALIDNLVLPTALRIVPLPTIPKMNVRIYSLKKGTESMYFSENKNVII